MEDFFCCCFSFRQTALTPLIPATPQDLNTNNDETEFQTNKKLFIKTFKLFLQKIIGTKYPQSK
jgi:hypothetical protein